MSDKSSQAEDDLPGQESLMETASAGSSSEHTQHISTSDVSYSPDEDEEGGSDDGDDDGGDDGDDKLKNLKMFNIQGCQSTRNTSF